MGDRLFVVQVVVAVEDQWFAPGTDGPPIRAERRHHIAAHLFAAPDAEAALLAELATLDAADSTLIAGTNQTGLLRYNGRRELAAIAT